LISIKGEGAMPLRYEILIGSPVFAPTLTDCYRGRRSDRKYVERRPILMKWKPAARQILKQLLDYKHGILDQMV
jgi:hypothetical protein